jgi:aminopeptidase YwaD
VSRGRRAEKGEAGERMKPTQAQSGCIEHVRQLSGSIGPRPIGSAGNQAAAVYIGEVLRSAGLDVEEQEFACPVWEHEETVLETGGVRVEAAANVYSPACDVAAPTVAVGTVAELETADIAGRLCILAGDLSSAPLTPKGYANYTSERDERIVALLEEKRPAAVITVNLRPGCFTSLIEDWHLPFASATVAAEGGLALLRDLGRPSRLRIAAGSRPSRSANVVGRRRGVRPERVVLCAHYDTKVGTPGALDNAAGVAVVLAVAEALAERGLQAGLECIAFSDHEYYGLGNAEYLRRNGHELPGILAVINLDGVGYRLGTNTVAIMANSADFRTQVDDLMKGLPGAMWTDPWPQSDHSVFAYRGVPSIAVTSIGATHLSHRPVDTVDWVGPEKLAEAAGLAIGIVEGLQDRSPEWTREPWEAGG